MKTFKYIYGILKELENEPSTKKKVEILKSYNHNIGFKRFKDFLFLALRHDFRYNLKKLPKTKELKSDSSFSDVTNLLMQLSSQTGTKKQEALELASLCLTEESRYVVQCILEKDLKCGVSVKLINKALGKDFILDHSPMLCYYAVRYLNREKTFSKELDIFVKKCGGWKSGIFGSVKEDGVRVWASLGGNYVSRNGINYVNFKKFNKAVKICIKKIAEDFGIKKEKIILDGEIISIDDNFQEQMTQVRKLHDADPSMFIFKIFDFIGPELSLDEKRSYMEEILAPLLKKAGIKRTTIHPHDYIDSEKAFKKMFFDAISKGKEGLVLKAVNGKYELKRSAFWCKIKEFFSADLKVIGYEISKKKAIKGLVGALIVDFKGIPVKVGSGYSKEQRKAYLKKRPKLIEVEYKSVTKDGSLFHPTFKRERDFDKTEVSYK